MKVKKKKWNERKELEFIQRKNEKEKMERKK